MLAGSSDQLTVPDRAQETAQAGDGELRGVPGAAPLSNLDQPAAFNSALLEWLQA